ncbi:MAG TPA: hypothetical protein VMY37_08720 [Thermoguttaceae bacterium]|nr:hypothetical protein [Thermoguttaceae bacterium]
MSSKASTGCCPGGALGVAANGRRAKRRWSASGLRRAYRIWNGSLRPSFYGLRTTVVTLFLCALLRIKRPEQLKEHRPGDLGQIVGLDRTPGVKTIRRHVSRLAAAGQGKVLMEELARARNEEDCGRIAFLYVDGNVREYHGKSRLSRAKKAQRQVITPAATDTWVHDAHGEPLLVVTSEMNAQLTQVLEPILDDVKRLVPPGRRITVIFDRREFSPKLFAPLIAAGLDVIAYREGKTRKLPQASFAKQRRKIEGLWREYGVCDRPQVRLGRLHAKRKKRDAEGPQYLWLREVRVLRDDGRQTPILTNRTELEAVESACRIFHRCRQENFLKYMADEFALDALVEYGVEKVSASSDRPNPQWVKATKQLKPAKAEVARLQAELGEEAADNDEATRPTMRGFKIAHADLRRKLHEAEARVRRLFAKRKTIPKRIPASDLETLKTEKKLIVDAIKIAAYQAEGVAPAAPRSLPPGRRRGPHPPARRLPIPRASGSDRRRSPRPPRRPVLPPPHRRADRPLPTTRRHPNPLPRHQPPPAVDRRAPRTHHFVRGLCQEV